MSRVTQTIMAGGHERVPGNCVQAAFATVLDLPLEAVPHFALFRDRWVEAMTEWLAEFGLVLEVVKGDEIPSETCIVAGTSHRDIGHVCVAERGEIVWDPHPSRAGLASVDESWIVRSVA